MLSDPAEGSMIYPPDLGRRILYWNEYHSGLFLILNLTVWLTNEIRWLVLGGVLSVLTYLWTGRKLLATYAHPPGYANSLTLFRFILVSIVAFNYNGEFPVLAGLVLVVALCLDGFDGYLARRFSQTSAFGQYLDMETDAYAVCVISILVWKYHDVGLIVLLAGILRYVYVVLVRVLIREHRFEPKRWYASVVAVIFYLSMILCMVSDHRATVSLVFVCSILLIGSFSRSFWYQWVARGTTSQS